MVENDYKDHSLAIAPPARPGSPPRLRSLQLEAFWLMLQADKAQLAAGSKNGN